MPAISVLMKPSSGMCNMDCDYCFYCDETAKRQQESYGFMSEQTLKNVIRKTMLRAEGMVSYAFQGGEPTLRDWISFAGSWNMRDSITKRDCKYRTPFRSTGFSSMRIGALFSGSIIFWWAYRWTAPEKSMTDSVT